MLLSERGSFYLLTLHFHSWEKLPDPDVEPPGVEPSLAKLVREVKYVLESESTIIAKVFPQPEQVLGKFLQRVFQQSVCLLHFFESVVQHGLMLLRFNNVWKWFSKQPRRSRPWLTCAHYKPHVYALVNWWMSSRRMD